MKLFLLLSILFLASCHQESIEVIYEIKNENLHPSGMRQKAVLAVDPAELNVGDGYQVYVLPEKESIKGNDYGIVFSANNWDNGLPRDSSDIKLKWLSRDTLKITYHKKLRILNQVIRTRDNVIEYEQSDSPGQMSKLK